MEVEKLKQRIEMKETFEEEIKEALTKLGEKATEILIKNDEIFNSGNSKFSIFRNYISTRVHCDLPYYVLKELDKKLKPSKIILTGGGTDGGMYSGQTKTSYIIIKLYFD